MTLLLNYALKDSGTCYCRYRARGSSNLTINTIISTLVVFTKGYSKDHLICPLIIGTVRRILTFSLDTDALH